MLSGREALRVIKRVYVVAEARGYAHASNHYPLMVWSMSSYDAPLCTKPTFVIKDSSARFGLLAMHNGMVMGSFDLHKHPFVPI